MNKKTYQSYKCKIFYVKFDEKFMILKITFLYALTNRISFWVKKGLKRPIFGKNYTTGNPPLLYKKK